MQIGTGDRLAELEVGLERRAHGGERMNVLSEHPEYPVPVEVVIDGAERAALGYPPVDRSLVVAGDVEFVDHEPPAGPDQRGEIGTGLLERVDVVQRHDRDRRVEGTARVEQRDPLDAGARLLGWVDRGDLPAGGTQLAGELSLPGADLEDPGRWLGQRGPDVREQVRGKHRPMIAKDA